MIIHSSLPKNFQCVIAEQPVIAPDLPNHSCQLHKLQLMTRLT